MTYNGSKYIENEFLNIGRGQVRKTSFIHKFGSVPSMSVNTTGSIWDVNDTLYPWATTWDLGASVLTVDAANAAEVGHSVTIYGLDANLEEIQETVVLATQTGNTTTNQFARVYRAYHLSEAGPTAHTNVGNIDIKYGTTVVARIRSGKGQTLMAIYTVPADCTGYLTKGVSSCQLGGDATGEMYVRFAGQKNFRIGHEFEVSGAGGQYNYDFTVPLSIPGGSDIDVRANVRTNNSRITAAFDMILIKNK